MIRTLRGSFWALCGALALALVVPAWSSRIDIHWFVPPVVAFVCQLGLTGSMWMAFAIGALVDCLTVQPRLGFCALAYALTAWGLWHVRHAFFRDSWWTLPVLTAFFSAGAAGMQLALGVLFDLGLSGERMGWLLIGGPLLDGAACALVFLPCMGVWSALRSRRVRAI